MPDLQKIPHNTLEDFIIPKKLSFADAAAPTPQKNLERNCKPTYKFFSY